MTILCGAIMILLFASETRDYLTPEIREELIVDTTRAGKLKINIDVVFPRISCDYLVLDAMDVSGEQHIDIEHNMFKRKLDLDGKPIEDPQKQAVIGVQKVNSTSEAKGSEVFQYLQFILCWNLIIFACFMLMLLNIYSNHI